MTYARRVTPLTPGGQSNCDSENVDLTFVNDAGPGTVFP